MFQPLFTKAGSQDTSHIELVTCSTIKSDNVAHITLIVISCDVTVSPFIRSRGPLPLITTSYSTWPSLIVQPISVAVSGMRMCACMRELGHRALAPEHAILIWYQTKWRCSSLTAVCICSVFKTCIIRHPQTPACIYVKSVNSMTWVTSIKFCNLSIPLCSLSRITSYGMYVYLLLHF